MRFELLNFVPSYLLKSVDWAHYLLLLLWKINENQYIIYSLLFELSISQNLHLDQTVDSLSRDCFNSMPHFCVYCLWLVSRLKLWVEMSCLQNRMRHFWLLPQGIHADKIAALEADNLRGTVIYYVKFLTARTILMISIASYCKFSNWEGSWSEVIWSSFIEGKADLLLLLLIIDSF